MKSYFKDIFITGFPRPHWLSSMHVISLQLKTGHLRESKTEIIVTGWPQDRYKSGRELTLWGLGAKSTHWLCEPVEMISLSDPYPVV